DDPEVLLLLACQDVQVAVAIEVNRLNEVVLHPGTAVDVVNIPSAVGDRAALREPDDSETVLSVLTSHDDVELAVAVHVAHGDALGRPSLLGQVDRRGFPGDAGTGFAAKNAESEFSGGGDDVEPAIAVEVGDLEEHHLDILGADRMSDPLSLRRVG